MGDKSTQVFDRVENTQQLFFFTQTLAMYHNKWPVRGIVSVNGISNKNISKLSQFSM